jgi:hypothetical protein
MLGRKSEQKRPIGSCRCTQEVNIKMDLKEIGCEMWTGIIWLKIGGSGRLL